MMSLLCSLEMQGIWGRAVHPHLNMFFLFDLLKQKFCLIRVQSIHLCPYIFATRLDKQPTLLSQFEKHNNFHLILNLAMFWKFWPERSGFIPHVPFHMFHSALEKPLNQIEPCSIQLIKPPKYKKLFFITIFNHNDTNNNIENYYYYFH